MGYFTLAPPAPSTETSVRTSGYAAMCRVEILIKKNVKVSDSERVRGVTHFHTMWIFFIASRVHINVSHNEGKT